MKKYIFTALLALAGLCSCSDYLDKEPDTEITLDEVFSQKILQERWLSHCYSMIPDPYYNSLSQEGTDIMGDDFTVSERYQSVGWNTIPWRFGNWNTESSQPLNYWSNLPKVIRSCKIFQERAQAVPGEGLTAAEVSLMKIETRFLVAYYYWLMIKTYGPVPFVPGGYLAPTDFDLSDLMIGPEPWDDIVNWIDQELLEVSELLPASYTANNKYGRATSIMCLAVRARMLLFNASPLVNGNPDYANHVDSNGRHLFPVSYDQQKWQRAADACKLLIDKAEAAGYQLYYEYNDDGSIDPFSSYQNLFLPTNALDCPEILFARPSSDYGTFQRHTFTTAERGNGGLGVTQEYVDAFFMKNGLLIDDENSGYVESGFSTQNDLRTVDWEAGEPTDNKHVKNIAHAGTYNMYVNREPRFYVCVGYSGAWYTSLQRYLDIRFEHDDNNGTFDAPQSGYFCRKRVHPNFMPDRQDYYRPGILYRLGEAYLSYAEALNEAGTNQSDMLFYLNKIRERAGVRQYTTGLTDNMHIHVDAGNKDEMRRLIHAERRVELGCEGGLRFFDMRRWKIAEEKLNGYMHGMNFKGAEDGSFYVRSTYESKRVFRKAFYWYPIGQTEIDKNPKLVQAPFWNTGE